MPGTGPLAGKSVVVCGVGPGLGREIAVAALRDGADVTIGARRAEQLAKTAAEIDPDGTRVAHQPVDIREEEQCATLAAHAIERFGKIDALINCAAKDSSFGGLAQADWAAWREVLDVNVIGTLQMTKAALPALTETQGAVVFISSQSMWKAPSIAPQTAYAASKGALLSASYALADELGPLGIRVNTVVPSWMWGPNVEKYVEHTANARGISQQEVVDKMTRHWPLRRMATDGDVADAAVFLASDRARSITGQSILVNCGEVMR